MNALNMMPYLLYPRYQLLQLYKKNGYAKSVKEIAIEILNMKVKVSSKSTIKIKQEAKKYLNDL